MGKLVYGFVIGGLTVGLTLGGELISGGSGTARAQTAQTDSADSEGGVLEEIIVTARRRGENLQRTPLSVSAFSAQDMANRNADNLRDIMQFAPNVLMIENTFIGGASGNAFIRGIGQLDYVITTDPGVGTYIDGVYMARSMGLLQSLIDIERVEVLRGPQGTLYGKNTIGGAIRIVSAKPDNEYSGKVEFTGGRFTRADIKADINVPLIDDRLFMKIAGGSTNRDGYGHTLDIAEPGFNRQDGIDRGDDQGLIGRLQLRWLASENLTVDFSLDGSRQRSHQAPGTLTAIFPDGSHPLLGIFFNPALTYAGAYAMLGRTFDLSQITGDPFVSRATGPQQADMDAWGLSTVIDWQAGKINIKSITAYRELKMDIGIDADHTEFDLLEQEELNNQDQFSQEIQISGSTFDDRLNWVIGGYYLKENADRFILGHILGDFWRAALFPQVIDTGVANDIMASAKTLAGFGQGTFEFTDQLSLTAGVRVSSEKKKMTGIQRGFFARVENDRATVNDSWTSVSPRFGIEYQWTDDVMTYLSAARGFKSGGFTARLNPGAPDAGIVSYDPEQLWTFEGGIRSEFADGSARANLTVFYSDYTDIQVTFQEFVDALLFTGLANVASARIKGAEFELTAMPAPGLVLNGSIGYIDAEYTAIGPTATDITLDSRFPRTPKWSFSVGGQYEHIVTSGSVLFRADYSYRSSTQASEASNVIIDQGGFGLLSARIVYTHGDGEWQMAAFMTNITDERYLTGGSENPGMFAQTNAGRPREWGIQATYRF